MQRRQRRGKVSRRKNRDIGSFSSCSCSSSSSPKHITTTTTRAETQTEENHRQSHNHNHNQPQQQQQQQPWQGAIKVKRGVFVGGRRGGPFSPLSSSSSPYKIMRPFKRSPPILNSFLQSPDNNPQNNFQEEPSLVDDVDDESFKEAAVFADKGGGGEGALVKALPAATAPSLKTVSARKLAASLWELQSIAVMKKASAQQHHKDSSSASVARTRDRSPLQLAQHLSDRSQTPPPPPIQVTLSNGSHRKQLTTMLKHQHALSERNAGALQALTPGSCSSLEVGALDQAATPTSSIDLKIRPTDSGYSLATSTELLKVLNRIWSLEEQHASSMSLVTALRVELDHARARVQELIQEQKADRHQMENLIKRFADEKMMWKSKEQERIKTALQSVKDELEDERKLRRRSESLHRKLAREVSEIKTAFSKALQELERERRARQLVENFCDELTMVVGKDFEEKEDKKEGSDKMKSESRKEVHLLNMAELWKEERVHVKLAEARFDLEQKEEIMERLIREVETFLKDRQANYHTSDLEDAKPYKRQSIESMHLNCMSAPQDVGDDESVDSDMHSIELNRNSVEDNILRGYKLRYASLGASNETKGRKSCEQKSQFQLENKIQKSHEKRVPFEDQLGSAKSWQGSKVQILEKLKSAQANYTKTAEGAKEQNQEAEERLHDSKSLRNDIHANSKSAKNGDMLARTQSLQSECSGIKEEIEEIPDCYPSQTSWRSLGGGIDHLLGKGMSPVHGVSSPTRQWNHQQLSSDNGRFRTSFDRPRGMRENSLRAKLLEAKLEGQQARLRNAKGF